MRVLYPNFSKLVGFNCHNKLEPFYTLSAIDILILDEGYCRNFHIPLGFTSDGCTLKWKLIRFIFGCPHTPEYLAGSIVHDFFCKHRYLINRKRASETLKYMLLREGVGPYKASIMVAGVDLFQKYWRKWN